MAQIYPAGTKCYLDEKLLPNTPNEVTNPAKAACQFRPNTHKPLFFKDFIFLARQLLYTDHKTATIKIKIAVSKAPANKNKNVAQRNTSTTKTTRGLPVRLF
ncbi:MAG: hypothetical protein CMI09_13345 [Oceanospirillaceae bacterium]|nr:hypothetical protein [Oceanospirillaceae bacterium]